MTTQKVKSADGTAIAFETDGAGPPLILVGGAFCDRGARSSGRPLAALLAPHFTVYSYDRRGRGDSEDQAEWSPQREIEDLAALIAAAGGPAFVYGMSSGALLAFAAALKQLPISKLALYEPPLMVDAQRAAAIAEVGQVLIAATAAQQRTRAVEIFMTQALQMPAAAVANMQKAPLWPGLEALSHTLSYDARICALGPSLLLQASEVRSRMLAVTGDAAPEWLRAASSKLVDAVPGAQQRTLAGQTHDVDIRVLAPVLSEFFSAI